MSDQKILNFAFEFLYFANYFFERFIFHIEFHLFIS